MTKIEKEVKRATVEIAFSDREKTADRLRALKMLLDGEKEERKQRDMLSLSRRLDAIAASLGRTEAEK